MHLGGPIGFPLGGDPPIPAPSTCWTGTLSDFEARLLTPRRDYALEQLRARLLVSVVTGGTLSAARATLQMALETELAVVISKVATIDPDVMASNVCERRRYLDVDITFRSHHYLVAPAFAALAKIPDMPLPYVGLVRRYAGSAYPRYRMSALAAAVCLATAMEA